LGSAPTWGKSSGWGFCLRRYRALEVNVKLSDEIRIKLAITILPWWLRNPIANVVSEDRFWEDKVKNQRVATWYNILEMWRIRPR
jgi:hypothetical protein